jgi:hypothetical protein
LDVTRSVMSTSILSGKGACRALIDHALLGRQLKAIPDPKLGQEVGRAGRVGFELLPKTSYEDPKILDLIGVRRPPNLPQQVALRKHLTGMSDEMPQ